MITRKKKICKVCGLDKYLFSQGRCQQCTLAQSKPLAKKRKITGEKNLFLELWAERPHICTNCKAPLGDEPIVHYFSHNHSKGSRPDLRLDKSNITILCKECHFAYEFQGEEAFNARKR